MATGHIMYASRWSALYVDGIGAINNIKGIKAAIFSDDISIVTTTRNQRLANKALQEAVHWDHAKANRLPNSASNWARTRWPSNYALRSASISLASSGHPRRAPCTTYSSANGGSESNTAWTLRTTFARRRRTRKNGDMRNGNPRTDSAKGHSTGTRPYCT